MRNFIAKLALLLLILSVPALLRAQDNAAMTGIVTDATGAVVAGTSVVLANSHTGVKFTQTTNGQGSYRFANVPPDPGYTATFSHPGFADVVVQGLDLTVGITRTQNEQLTAGKTERVEVSANGNVTLNTTDATIGNDIDVKLLNELPVQDRTSGITTLFFLQPGVDSASGSVTGAREDQSEVTVDGMDVNDIAAGSTFAIVSAAPVDSVQEFRGVVAGFVPGIGTGSGGQFQLVTKNGDNTFHGNINEYHRDTSTVANDYFNNLVGVARPPLIRNQFGGNLGGPILKDKLFFFFNFGDSRIVQSANVEQTVPLDSYRNQMVNYISGNIDPATGQTCADNSRLNVNPACIETLQPTDVLNLDPLGAGFNPAITNYILANYPHVNDVTQGDGINTGGYRFTTPVPDFLTNYVARVDYNLTPKQRVFARGTIERENATESTIQFPGEPAPTNPFIDRSYSYVVSHIWEIGNNKVNQFYYGDTISKFDFPALFNPSGTDELGLSGISSAFPPQSSQQRRIPIPELRDDFNWQLGKHNLAFGGTFKFIKTHSKLVNDFNFVNIGLGGELFGLDDTVEPSDIGQGPNAQNAYSELYSTALGRVGAVTSNYNYTTAETPIAQGSGTVRHYRYYETEGYLGDTWKVEPHLTLSYGVRYQLYTVPYETTGAQSVPFLTNQNGTTSSAHFDNYFSQRVAQSAAGIEGDTSLPFVTYQLGGKANNGPATYAPSYKDLAPRFAFSYNPAYSPKTVINGSGAIVYDRTVINAVNFIQDQSSYLDQNSSTVNYGCNEDAYDALANDPRVGAGSSNATLNYGGPVAAPVITKPYTPYVDANGHPFGLAGENCQGGNDFSYVVDPNLKDPYNIMLNAGIQQELPGHLIMKVNYTGRLGRRLIAQADASQLVDFTDPASGQTMGQAFANLTEQVRNGATYNTVTAQPFFENQINNAFPGIGGLIGLNNNTAILPAFIPQLVQRGDFADSIQFLAASGIFPTNVGEAAQFAGNTYITNKGSSSYNALLFTLSRNFSQGLQFDVNYTWSHSIDNTSQVANSISSGTGYGFICDVQRPRECRANSDFDVTQEVNGDVVYDLPFGRGKQFANTIPTWLDEAIGGWGLSAIPFYRSGQALNIFSDAYVAGYANDAPAIFTGNKNDLNSRVNKNNGSIYQFSNVNQVLSDFQGPIGFQVGERNQFRGPKSFTLDAGLAKRFPIRADKLGLVFRADAFNVLNHPVFSSPQSNIIASNFGQISSTSVAPRVAQFALRLEF